MKLLKKSVLAVAMAAAAISSTAFADDGRYVLVLKKNANTASVAASVAAAGGTVARSLPQVGIVIATSSNPNFAAAAKSIGGVQDAGPVATSALPDAEVVHFEDNAGEAPDTDASAPTPADTRFNLGHLWGINRVGAPAAWAAGNTGEGATIAIIDTGVASNHPDFDGKIVDYQCFASVACNPYPSLSFHGTHVAGTATAQFGHGLFIGVAPQASLASYNVFENIVGCGVCAFSDSRWAAMIDAADKGYDVINMSLGSLSQFGGQGTNELAAFVQAEKKVADYVSKQGTVMVASAGNSAVDLNGTLINLPGGIPEIVNVGATAIRPLPIYPQMPAGFDIRAAYSNYGASVDVSAPGGDCNDLPCSFAAPVGNPSAFYLILSAAVTPNPVCAATQSCPVAGTIGSGGTSMAAPHVTGVVALMRAADPGLSVNQIKARLKSSAENVGSRQEFGHGMVQADDATN